MVDFEYAEGLAARDGGKLKGFAIAGDDKKFVWADATIEASQGRRLQSGRSLAVGRALRLGEQPRLQPGQRGRPASLAVPHGRLGGIADDHPVRLPSARFS